MAQLARELDLNREGLYESLSPNGNPSFITVMKVLDNLGFQLNIQQNGLPSINAKVPGAGSLA
jgi:probable addiction module antidote protein